MAWNTQSNTMLDADSISTTSSPKADVAMFYVMGSTGTGKTRVSVEMARRLREKKSFAYICVINCDVLQFYDGLPVATNKAALDELTFADGTAIPHFFMSFLSLRNGEQRFAPTTPYHDIVNGCAQRQVRRDSGALGSMHRQAYHVHEYVRDVENFLHRVVFPKYAGNGGCAVIVCGGSCYYLQALLFEGMLVADEQLTKVTASDGGDSDGALSIPTPETEGLDEKALALPRSSRWKELKEVDPAAAASVHPNNVRRIERQLEIYYKTGQRPSVVFQAQQGTDGANTVPSSTRRLRYHFSVACSLNGTSVQVHPRLLIIWVFARIEWLAPKLDARVVQMLDKGMLEEVTSFFQSMQHAESELLTNKRPRDACETSGGEQQESFGTIATAIGFKEWAPLISALRGCPPEKDASLLAWARTREELSKEFAECTLKVQQQTRRYAKQQTQWIRNRLATAGMKPLWVQAAPSIAEKPEMAVPFLKLNVDAAPLQDSEEVAKFLSSTARLIVDEWLQSGGASMLPIGSALNSCGCVENVFADASPQNLGGNKLTLHHCALCGKYLSGDIQWAAHLASKGHRGALKHEALVEQQRLLGREIPPRSQKR